MIYLDDDFCTERFNEIPSFFDHLDKTCNFELCWLIIFFRNNKKSKKEED